MCSTPPSVYLHVPSMSWLGVLNCMVFTRSFRDHSSPVRSLALDISLQEAREEFVQRFRGGEHPSGSNLPMPMLASECPGTQPGNGLVCV